MEIIDEKQINLYKKILQIDKITDINTIIRNYKNALYEFCLEDTYDIGKLSLIIKSFKYFSGFENDTFDVNLIYDIAIDIINNKRKSAECFIYEFICMYSFVIAKKLNVLDNFDNETRDNDCKVLYQLMTTIKPIMNHEISNIKIKRI